MMSVVRSSRMISSTAWMAASFVGSRELVASSRTRIRGSFRRARAMDNLWRSPPESRLSTVPNNALIAARQRRDGLVNLGQPCRDFNVAFRCVRPSISHIVQYAGVKQIRLLRHQANVGAKGFELDVPEIVAVDQYPAGGWIVDAKQQACQRALAGS